MKKTHAVIAIALINFQVNARKVTVTKQMNVTENSYTYLKKLLKNHQNTFNFNVVIYFCIFARLVTRHRFNLIIETEND